jgi:hypothetical protein
MYDRKARSHLSISKFIKIKTFGFIHLFFTILLLLDGYWINIGKKEEDKYEKGKKRV